MYRGLYEANGEDGSNEVTNESIARSLAYSESIYMHKRPTKLFDLLAAERPAHASLLLRLIFAFPSRPAS